MVIGDEHPITCMHDRVSSRGRWCVTADTSYHHGYHCLGGRTHTRYRDSDSTRDRHSHMCPPLKQTLLRFGTSGYDSRSIFVSRVRGRTYPLRRWTSTLQLVVSGRSDPWGREMWTSGYPNTSREAAPRHATPIPPPTPYVHMQS